MSQHSAITTSAQRVLDVNGPGSPWSSPSVEWPTRVLIVEDDPGDVCLIREALVDGVDRLLEARTVDRVSSAVDELTLARFDCVLLDLGLPDSTALDGLSRILEAQQGIAVVVVTGREDHQLGLEAVRLGAQDYLTKHESFGRQLHHVVGYAVERARALLRERRLALLLDRASQVVLVIDAHLQVSYASASIVTMLGCEVHDVIGADVSVIVDPRDMPVVRDHVRHALRDPNGLRSPIAVRATHADGDVRWYEVSVDNLLHDAAIDGLIVNARDITERKHAEFEIERMAFHDSLTGLPSRTRLTTLLAESLRRAGRRREGVAIAVLDLDHFKAINDSLGHATGDALLVAVAQRIESALRHPEILARFGGDEFAILIEGALGPDTRDDLGDRLAIAMETPISIGSGDYRISITGGLAMSRADSTADTLVRDADTALYHAKEEHRGRLALFASISRVGHDAGWMSRSSCVLPWNGTS